MRFTRAAYPGIAISVEPWKRDPTRLAISFVESKFTDLYPAQRYHQLVHLIPQDFSQEYLVNTVWFELAPGESADDLRYPDDQTIEKIRKTS